MANSSKLDEAIKDVSELLPGKTSAAPMMKFIASAESDYGRYDDETALSYGPFQIDPVRYYDIVQNPERVNQERLGKVNKFLQGKFNDPTFDISTLASYNPETMEYGDIDLEKMRDPLIGASLTRMALMQDPGELPVGVENMGKYYLDFWRPKKQTEEKKKEAIGKYKYYHPEEVIIDDNKMLNKAFSSR